VNATRTTFTRASAVLLLALGCGSSNEPAVGTLRVLFIGNSLTYANDLPAMVAALADESTAGALQIYVRDVSNPDFALEDHWDEPRTIEALNELRWDFVILQQGPSSLPENQVNLREWATRFAGRIRSDVGGRPALFMVWPDVTRLEFFDAVSESYRNAAEAADAALYPAGEAWRAAWAEDPSLRLYGDGYHPSVMGSYLAALTIYHGLTGRSVLGVSAPLGVSTEVAAILQRAAEQATAQFGRP
jgi:hypothetical protein